jgi:hypothetical protein
MPSSPLYEFSKRTSPASADALAGWLGLATIPVLLGLVMIRQTERTLAPLGEFSESLLQGEQLPILESPCSPEASGTQQEAVP